MNSFISVEKRRLASDSINPLELHHFWVLDDVSHFPTEHPPCPFAHRSRELRCLCHRVEQRCAHYCSLAFVEAANWHRRVGQKQPLVCGRGGACDKAAASVLRDCSAGAGLSRAVRCNNSKCVNSRTFHNRRAQRSSQDSEIGWYHGMKSIFSCVPCHVTHEKPAIICVCGAINLQYDLFITSLLWLLERWHICCVLQSSRILSKSEDYLYNSCCHVGFFRQRKVCAKPARCHCYCNTVFPLSNGRAAWFRSVGTRACQLHGSPGNLGPWCIERYFSVLLLYTQKLLVPPCQFFIRLIWYFCCYCIKLPCLLLAVQITGLEDPTFRWLELTDAADPPCPYKSLCCSCIISTRQLWQMCVGY